MTTAKKKLEAPDQDALARLIADSLNSVIKNSGEKVAYFLDGSEDTPMDLDEYISTGNTVLDLAISNRPHGGIAVGRITELTGLEGSGKSLVGTSIIRSTQQSGGIAVLIDTEIATNKEFLQAQGVDLSRLVIVNTDIVEDIFDAIVNIIEKVRAANATKKLVTIVVDSVAAASTKREIAADFDKDGYATDKAIIISKAMRKITVMLGRERIALVFTNQLRQKLNAPSFSDPWTTSGGKAIAFHSSTRIRLSQIAKIKDKDGTIVGVAVKANIVKNRLGPPYRTAEFEVYFNRGMDDSQSWLKVMKDHDIVKRKGAWYIYTYNGEETTFQGKDIATFLEENPERREHIYSEICEAVIMKYQATDKDPDEFSLVEAGDDE